MGKEVKVSDYVADHVVGTQHRSIDLVQTIPSCPPSPLNFYFYETFSVLLSDYPVEETEIRRLRLGDLE